MSWIAVVGTTILAMATTLSAQNRKPDHYLDVLGISRSATSLAAPYVPWDNMIVSVSHPVFDTTIKLTLVSVDVPVFAWGDYFVYEVLIENTGKKPVTLPWSPDRGAFGQAEWGIPSGFRRGSLYLEVLPADGGSDVLGVLEGETLYGSPGVPGSLLVLAPGRTALLRVPAQWTRTIPDGSMKTILRQPEGAVRIRARYSSRTNEIATTPSTNAIPVRVFPRPPD